MKLRTDYNVYNIEKCPNCKFLVYYSDMLFKAGEPFLCRFCLQKERESLENKSIDSCPNCCPFQKRRVK